MVVIYTDATSNFCSPFFYLIVDDTDWNETGSWKKSQNQSLSPVYEHLIKVAGNRWKRAQTNVPVSEGNHGCILPPKCIN